MLRAVPGGEAADAALEVGFRDKLRQLPGTRVFFWGTREQQGRTEGEQPPGHAQGPEPPLPPRELGPGLQRFPPRRAAAGARSRREPGLRPADSRTRSPRRALAGAAAGARAAGWAWSGGGTAPGRGGRRGSGGGTRRGVGREPPVLISSRSCSGGARRRSCSAGSPAARRGGGGGAGAQGLAGGREGRERRAGAWGRSRPDQSRETAAPAAARERAEDSARARARGRGRAGPARPFRPHPPPPLPLPTFFSPPAPPHRAPTLSSSCGSVVRVGGRSGPGRAGGPGDGAAGPGPRGNGRLRVRPLLGAVADAFHGHHLHVSEGLQEGLGAGVRASGTGENGNVCALKGTGLGRGWRKLILRLFPPHFLAPRTGSGGGLCEGKVLGEGRVCWVAGDCPARRKETALTCQAE